MIAVNPVDWNTVFHTSPEAAIEDFDDGSLVLLCEQLRLVELNPTARSIVGMLDGVRSTREIAEAVAQLYGAPFEQAHSDVVELLADLEEQGVVERHDQRNEEKKMTGETKQYQVNPDVSCREEAPDGAILFNPDKNDVMAINPVGLLIWRALNKPRTQEEIAAHLLEVCEGAPPEQVGTDVSEFIQTLVPGGFVGEVVAVGA